MLKGVPQLIASAGNSDESVSADSTTKGPFQPISFVSIRVHSWFPSEYCRLRLPADEGGLCSPNDFKQHSPIPIQRQVFRRPRRNSVVAPRAGLRHEPAGGQSD